MLKLYPSSLGLAVAMATVGFTTPGALAEEQASRSDNQIEEIIVTSRRKQESVQDVPLSVTVFDANALNRLKPTTLRDLDGLAPNVYIGMSAATPGGSTLYVRGIGYADVEKTQSPQVGVIVDGIQLGSSTGQLVDVFDVESIEINRGPQGVLFGKNTIAGNIVVNRIRPQFNDVGFNLSAQAGNYDSTSFKARINVPLIDDQLALKIGHIQRERDGYYDNDTLGGSAGDIDFQSTTLALRWAPSDNFEAILTYDNIDDASAISPQDPRFDGDNPHKNLADKPEPTSYQVDQVGLRVEWDINEALTLYSISGWNNARDSVNQDFDGATTSGLAVPFAQLHSLREQKYEVFSQEVRLAYAFNDDIDVMAGIYYFDSDLDFSQQSNNILQLPPIAIAEAFAALPCGVIGGIIGVGLRPHPLIGDVFCQFPNAQSLQQATEKVESWAYFGSLTWRINDDLEFNVGVRYIDEEKEATNAYFDYSTGAFDTGGFTEEFNFLDQPRVAGAAYAVKDDWSDTIWQTSLNWKFAENSRAYVSYSEGFRSGGFSIRSARDPSEATFQPEDAYQIEVGIKSDFFDRRLRVNLAYFSIERDAGQFSSIITLPPGAIPGTTTIINNGGKSTTSGVELETQWLINENFTLIANAGTIDADTDAFSLACDRVDGCVTAVPGILDPSGTLRNLGDSDDSRQPEWNVSWTLAFERRVGPGILTANVGYKKVGSFLLVNTGGGADQRLFEGGYDDWSANVSYEWELNNGDTMSISAFGKNLSDEEWKEQALFLGGPNTGFQGWGAPRTFAMEVKYSR